MQSTTARIAVAVVSVVVLAVLFVVLSGDEDAETTTQAELTTTTDAGPGEKPERTEKSEKPVKPPEPEVAKIELVGGEPKGGPADLEFTKGEQVRFEVASDVDDEIHVHGYDVYADLATGKTTEVDFPADIDGVFEIELHATGIPVAELTVQP
jgi:hypothetical protein